MKKKFFLRRALRFFLILLVPMLLMLVVSAAMLVRNLGASLQEQNLQALGAAQTNIQMVINTVLSENSYISSSSRTSLVLTRLSGGAPLSYADSISLHNLKSMLSSIAQTYDYIDSIYLYADGGTRAISSEKAVVLLSEGDTGWLDVYNAMREEETTCIAPRVYHALSGDIPLLTVCQRLPVRGGCVAVNINVAELQQMLETMRAGHYGSLYLISTQGELLASAGEDTGTLAAGLTAALRHAAAVGRFDAKLAEYAGSWVPLGGRHYLLTAQQIRIPGIAILSVIPQQAAIEEMLVRTTPLLAMLVVDLFVVLALAYHTTKRSFGQISAMMDMFEAAEQGVPVQKPAGKPQDEYDVIMNNMVRVFLNTSYLNMQLKEKQYSEENAELMALQLQINPHFLFNTLQTLDMEARRVEPEGHMSLIIRDVSDILKYSLSNAQQPVRLQEELTYLKKYVEVQKYRFGDHFIIYYEAEEEVMAAAVFRLMLQPVVENSLLHGIRGLAESKRGYIKVRLHRLGAMLELRVIDNGIGMDRAELEALRGRINNRDSRSIGLTNLNRRLVLRYGAASALRICSQKNLGTSVSFQIPLTVPEAPDGQDTI